MDLVGLGFSKLSCELLVIQKGQADIVHKYSELQVLQLRHVDPLECVRVVCLRKVKLDAPCLDLLAMLLGGLFYFFSDSFKL